MSQVPAHSSQPERAVPRAGRAITVTGSHGLVGGAVVAELRARGHSVTTLDLRQGAFVAPTGKERALAGDVCDASDVADALDGVDTVVHLAGIPGSNMASDSRTFEVNVMGTYNVFRLAVRLGLRRVIWASTESVFGVPFSATAPTYLPIDDDHPRRPTTAYATSKVVCESLADVMADSSQTSFVGLRLVHVMTEHDYASLSQYWDDAAAKAWNLWSYVDVRDVAFAVASAVEVELEGSVRVLISAADTVSPTPTEELVRAAFGDALAAGAGLQGHAAAFSIDHAKRLLGYEPRHSWRDSPEHSNGTEAR